jgi:hypothetical protein
MFGSGRRGTPSSFEARERRAPQDDGYGNGGAVT